MKKNDPYTRIEQQRFSTLGITATLLAITVVLVNLNPHNDLAYKMIMLIPFIALLLLVFLRSFALVRITDRLMNVVSAHCKETVVC